MSHAADVNGHTVGQRIGYTRVSTVAQTLDQQNDALAKSGVSKTFSDTIGESPLLSPPGIRVGFV
jgi:hypothetical protein